MSRNTQNNSNTFAAVELVVGEDGVIKSGDEELTLKQLIKVVRDRREAGQAAKKADRVKAQAEKRSEQLKKAEAAEAKAKARVAKLKAAA
jgi:hypothetical protein